MIKLTFVFFKKILFLESFLYTLVMQKLTKIFFLTLTLIAHDAFSCIEVAAPFQMKSGDKNNILKARLKMFQEYWSPRLFEKTHKTLSIQTDKETTKTKVYTTRDAENNPIIVISENIINHEDITPDGIDFILCHELGHHLGGAPKKQRGATGKIDWSSVEGQADYFASVKCLPLYYSSETKKNKKPDTLFYSQYSKEDVDTVRPLCRDSTCERIILAGLSFSRFYSTFRDDWKKPVPGIKTAYKVEETLSKHPRPQCRLETVVAGTSCQNVYDFDPQDVRVGACMEAPGKRPACWFAY